MLNLIVQTGSFEANELSFNISRLVQILHETKEGNQTGGVAITAIRN